MAARALLSLALLLLASCHGSPTAPQSTVPACSTASVFAGEAFYVDRGEAEQEFAGVLEYRDVPATPNGRDHRYFLNGVAVYSGGFTTEPALRKAAGTTVTLRGKLVNFTHGPEIWPATLTSCR